MTTRTLKHYAGTVKETKMMEVETPVIKDLPVTFPFFRKCANGDYSWINCLSVWHDGYHERFVESRIHLDHGRYTIANQEARDGADVAYDFTEPSYEVATAEEFMTALALAREQISARFDEKLGISK